MESLILTCFSTSLLRTPPFPSLPSSKPPLLPMLTPSTSPSPQHETSHYIHHHPTSLPLIHSVVFKFCFSLHSGLVAQCCFESRPLRTLVCSCSHLTSHVIFRYPRRRKGYCHDQTAATTENTHKRDTPFRHDNDGVLAAQNRGEREVELRMPRSFNLWGPWWWWDA